ncbi:unnamed protein product [Rotaria sordida]|uniref:Uncharacterized protein n=1 Tax=Rotaria sordida TaxID=392033 RepID=A0A813ZQ32_9BILA|nr:unnamed protein product [Rotaria sordida]
MRSWMSVFTSSSPSPSPSRSKNLANNAKQWQVEQRFTDRARESIKSHQPLHEINSYDRQGYFDIPTLLTDKTDNQMLVSIDETLDKSFQTATDDESNNQL